MHIFKMHFCILFHFPNHCDVRKPSWEDIEWTEVNYKPTKFYENDVNACRISLQNNGKSKASFTIM